MFDLAEQALTIFLVRKPHSEGKVFSTGHQKWHSDSRGHLFSTTHFTECPKSRPDFWVPKFSNDIEGDILSKCMASPTRMSNFVEATQHKVFYRNTGGRYWKVFTNFPPAFSLNGVAQSSSRETTFALKSANHVMSAVGVLSSNLFWWWYTITSNLRDLNPSDWQKFPVDLSVLDDITLQQLGSEYLADLQVNSIMESSQRQTGSVTNQLFRVQESKPVIDKLDRVLAEHYGFTDEELDYIINYDIKYRMGRS